MRAVQIDEYGGPEVMNLRDVPMPTPADGEVLIRMAFAGINVMDVATRKGGFATSQTYPVRLSTTLGMEGAGVVQKVGAGVSGLRPGDRVAYCLVWNSYADFAVVPAWQVVRVPEGLPLGVAAAATFQGFTAHYLAIDVGRLGPGRSCLVHAAAGGVGSLLVGFAVRLGATVYGTVRTEAQRHTVLGQGVADVYLSGDGGFVAPLREATGGRGVDVVFDSIGSPTLRHDFRAAAKKGLVISFGASGGAVDDLNPAELGEAGSLFLTRPRLKDHLGDAETIQRRAADLYSALMDGGLSMRAGGRYEMDQVRQAHIDVEQRTAVGKPLLVLNGDSNPG